MQKLDLGGVPAAVPPVVILSKAKNPLYHKWSLNAFTPMEMAR